MSGHSRPEAWKSYLNSQATVLNVTYPNMGFPSIIIVNSFSSIPHLEPYLLDVLSLRLQNPALHLFRVTGFLANFGPFQILFPSRVERRNLVREYCLISFIINYIKSQCKLGIGCLD